MSTRQYILEQLKRADREGRCLHFRSGTACDAIIDAHSVQNAGQLKSLAESGHIYRFSADFSSLARSGGRPTIKKIGMNQATTFRGFCKHHDNELFRPIDTSLFTASKTHAALYAYRSLCREVFVKTKAVEVSSSILEAGNLAEKSARQIRSHRMGSSIGLEMLNWHKRRFDEALEPNRFDEFEYLSFASESDCNVQLSGVFFPDYGFDGGLIQDFDDLDRGMYLITFFTAPTLTGWSFTFCWHASSHDVCARFVNSLAIAIRCGGRPQDILLRLVIKCCENHAIRVSWWDALSAQTKADIEEAVLEMATPDKPITTDYLTRGLEGVADWEFTHVYDSLSAARKQM